MPTNAAMERSDAIEAARQKMKLIREGILSPDDPKITFKRVYVQTPAGDGAAARTKPAYRYSLNIPSVRLYRFATSAGVTSFHFSHSTISKTSIERQKSDSRNSPGAARAHSVYIERGGALAKLPSDTKILARVQEYEHAENGDDRHSSVRHGPADGDHIDQAEGSIPSGASSKSADHDAYLIRPGAVAERQHSRLALITNIDDDQSERATFWKLVDEQEAKRGDDRLSIETEANVEFWGQIRERADCPSELKDALGSSNPADRAKFVIADGQSLRRYLAAQDGWPNSERNRAAAKQSQKCMGATFHDGRGGRTQNRIVGELPSELSVEQNYLLLSEFAQKFVDLDMPFVAVMHAPDLANDEQNWHFHLDYHDRPARRITDEDIRGLSRDGYDTSSLAPGRWDFDVSVAKRDRPGRMRRPLRQNKIEAVSRRRDWPLELRKHLADITNRHLQAANIERRVDHRTHAALGIKGTTQSHMGTSRSAIEVKGGVTDVGIENERRQWEAIQLEKEQAYDHKMDVLRRGARHKHASGDPSNTANHIKDSSENASADPALAARLLAAQLERDAELLELEIERGRSRAVMLKRKNERKVKEDAEGTPSVLPAADRECASIVNEASAYLSWLDGVFAKESTKIFHWRREAARQIDIAERYENASLVEAASAGADSDENEPQSRDSKTQSTPSETLEPATAATHPAQEQVYSSSWSDREHDHEAAETARSLQRTFIKAFLNRPDHETMGLERTLEGFVRPRSGQDKHLDSIDFSLAGEKDREVLEDRFERQQVELVALEEAWNESFRVALGSGADVTFERHHFSYQPDDLLGPTADMHSLVDGRTDCLANLGAGFRMLALLDDDHRLTQAERHVFPIRDHHRHRRAHYIGANDRALTLIGRSYGLELAPPDADEAVQAARAPQKAQAIWLAWLSGVLSNDPQHRATLAAFQAWHALDRARPIPF